VPEVDVVEVDLQDLVLLHPHVEQHGQDHLGDLAAPGALLGEEARLDDLLVDGGAALGDAAGTYVGEESASHADRIDAEVMVEAHIFRGQEGVADVARQRLQRHRRRGPPVDAVEPRYFAAAAGGDGDDGGRLTPGVAHQLARKAVIEDEEIDAAAEEERENGACDDERESRSAKWA